MSISSQYAQFEAKTDNYTLLVNDDVVNFVIATGKTATLPLAAQCRAYPDRKNRKLICNGSTSSAALTIGVTSPNTLVGSNSVPIGGSALLTSNEVNIWYMVGGSGVSGVSGFSGLSGKSGTSGYSGTSGFSGSSGTSGISGTSGQSGTSGISGTSGVSGKSGFSGTSGVSGVSGFSGTSGTSGF